MRCPAVRAAGRVCHPARYERSPGLGVTRRCRCGWNLPQRRQARRCRKGAGDRSETAPRGRLGVTAACAAARAAAAGQPSQSYNGLTRRRGWLSLGTLRGGSPMAERSAVGPPGVATSGHDVLLATKLHVPRPQPGFVPRPRLAGRLDEGLARQLILVCAPAGSGKTALLADWARRGRRPVAWLSLDAGDNDPARLWRHAVAALDRVRPGIAEQVGPLLGPPAPPSFEGLVTALVNELDAEPGAGGVLLVLDDYHLIDSQPVHVSLRFLLGHLPPGLRLVLASRSDPPLALARLRAGGTEGWAAGLQLAALSLRGQEDAAGFVAAFSGSHRYVLDYLAGEVLDRQTEELRGFLLETSVLERLSGALCDAVTGRADSQAMLEAIEHAGLFLVPLDEVRGWWRYHQLFADLLRARLRQERPERIPVLHKNAAAWHSEHGPADAAVRHAIAAGDMNWAARLMEQYFDELFYLHGEGATLERWFSALPAGMIRSRPRLLVAQAAQADTGGRAEDVGGLLDAAEHAYAGAAGEPFEPSAGRAASLLVNVPATIAVFRAYLAELHGDAEGAASFAAQALAAIGEGERMLDFITQGHLAIAEWLRGRLAASEQAFTSSIAGWRMAGLPTLIAWGAHHLGQVQRVQEALEAARGTYQEALEVNAPHGRPATPAAGIAYVGLGEVSYQRGDLDAALRYLTQGIALCRQFTYAPPLAAGLATLAWTRQAGGDPSGAFDAMGEAERAMPGPAVGLINPVPAQRARLLLARGDLAAAARWIQERGLGPDDEPDYPREPEYLVLARALTLACPQGYVRVFADEGPPMAALLGRLVAAQKADQAAARGVEIGCLARVLRAFGGKDDAQGAGRDAAAAVPGLAEQLTARELEILVLLAAGMPNPRIAGEL